MDMSDRIGADWRAEALRGATAWSKAGQPLERSILGVQRGSKENSLTEAEGQSPECLIPSYLEWDRRTQ